MYLACEYVFGAVPGGGRLLVFVVLRGGWIFWAYLCRVQVGMLGIVSHT